MQRDALLSELLELEELLINPHTRKSEKAINELLSDDFIEIGSSGLEYTKPDVIKALSKESSSIRYEIKGLRANQIEQNIALVTYTAIKLDTEKQTKVWSARSSVWKKEGGKWKILFNQGTPVKVA